MGVVLPGQGHVHAVKRAHDAGDHEDDGQAGEHLHDLVQVVGDDGAKGVAQAPHDLGEDLGHVRGLFVFYKHIVQQVAFFGRHGQVGAGGDFLHDRDCP